MNLSKEERNITMAVGRRRYAQLKGKNKRGAFLDEFCALTSLTRKHAIAALNAQQKPRARRRGPPKKHPMSAVNLLVKIWRVAGKPCGKLLHPVLPDYLASLRQHEPLDDETASQILSMSASTIDRRLRSFKPKTAPGTRRVDSLAEHRQAIGHKHDTWPANAKQIPGWLEADTVAHCGGNMAGSFVWTLDACDTATQWTEMRPVWNKGAQNPCDAFRHALRATPLDILGVNTDNGSEFLNHHLAREFPALCPGAVRSRSRAYVKNDNPHVEQKNGHAVRRILGYRRIDREAALKPLRELLVAESLFRNLFRATFKLLEKHRDGARWVKTFEKTPMTPAQRILASEHVSDTHKQRVRDLLGAHDPLTLRRRIDAARNALIRVLCAPAP
jgi:hypothetical protein